MRQQLRPVRAGVAAVLGVVLLASCSGDDGGSGDGGSAADTPATSSPAEDTAEDTAAGEDFCARAADLDQRVEDALAEVEGDASLPEVFRQLGEEMRDVDPPEEIAADWETMQAGLDRMADAVADLDLTDGDSVAALEEAGSGLDTASANVEAYLRDECGIG
ncbi:MULTISPECIES: hypothetical protein [unclassified Geodermatophilus]